MLVKRIIEAIASCLDVSESKVLDLAMATQKRSGKTQELLLC
ncbi:hypothetical protein SAMN05216262_103100 [Colwellia chukchiensis]|uniref:Uncharacterized protein n=1 Tax=Colwellia chukchiensis TaxID=641665 RepID=A0A1H7KCS5_9GAMM|nr:hypothetical protein SAMN05216262_103100 [Colwellia chukchiensis]